MQSLAFKLTLAFLLVGIVAVALVGAFVIIWTRFAFTQFNYERDLVSLRNMLESYYQTNGGWAGLETALTRPRFERMRLDWTGQSFAILDAERNLVYGRGEFARGKKMFPRSAAREAPLQVNGETVGWLIIGRSWPPIPDRSALPEEVLRRRIVSAILYGMLGAIGLALILGAILARTVARPIGELTEATRAVAKGQLGKQVPVRSQDELGQLTASFNRMSADLARTSEARRQMTADIAHELRTPLSVIVGYTEALQDGKLQGNATTYTAMHETAQHLQRLVEDLRILALADAGELTLNRRPVEPRALLERAVLTHLAPAQAAGVQVRLDAPADLPLVDVDPDRISQVLNNLMANALRYTPAGGEIALSAEAAPSGAQVILRVRDTGCGIAPEDLPLVFERFYRGDKARRQENGESGLGLAIARSIVEGHGGAISVVSAPDAGTTFSVALPAAAAPA